MPEMQVLTLGWEDPLKDAGNPFQYSSQDNPMDGGAWWATVHGVAKSQTRLSEARITCGAKFCILGKQNCVICQDT